MGEGAVMGDFQEVGAKGPRDESVAERGSGRQRAAATRFVVRLLAACGLAASVASISACGVKTCPSAGPTECPSFFPHQMHQATCSVTRVECAGWTFDPTSTIDEINCFGNNIDRKSVV